MPPKAKPAAKPAAKPRALRTFAADATAQHAALATAPSLDPEDVVLAGHPQLDGYGCIAVPGVPCPESVLRLAMNIDTFSKLDLTKNELGDLAPPLQVRCPAATIPEMKRRLERLQKGDFPVYVLVPGTPGTPPEFVLVDDERMKPRKDNWAIVYVPGWGAPARAAHWTFTTVNHINRPHGHNPHPCLIYTSMPITDLSPTVYWRCIPTASNMASYILKKNLGQACHCCHQLTCPHEISFRRRMAAWHPPLLYRPDVRMITLGDDLVFDGEWRAQVLSAGRMDNHTVRLGASASVEVVNEQGQVSTHALAWNVPAIRRPAFNFGYGMAPVEHKVWCIDNGVALPGYVKTFLSAVMRTKQTWEERIWPFYYWKYDIPKSEEDVIIRPYKLRISHLEKRKASPLRLLTTSATSAVVSYLSWCLLKLQVRRILQTWEIRVTTEQPIKLKVPVLDKVVKYFQKETAFVAWQLVTPDLYKSATSAIDWILRRVPRRVKWSFIGDACELLYPYFEHGIKKIPRVYLTCFYIQPPWTYLLAHIQNTAFRLLVALVAYYYFKKSIWIAGQTFMSTVASFSSYHFKTPAFSEPARRAFGDVTGSTIINKDKHHEINSRLAVRQEITRSVATDVFRRAMNETQWATTVSPAEFEAWLETVVNTPGESVSIPRVEAGVCITCLHRTKTYRGECKGCKKRRRTVAPEPLLGEPFVVYIGKVGLWSRDFELPIVDLKEDAYVEFRKKKYRKYESIMRLLSNFEIETSCRGWNAGPMIDSNLPQCFPRGYAVAVKAFIVRLGSERQHEAQEQPWRLWHNVMAKKAIALEPESREQFLTHFSGDKKRKMEDAFQQIDEGYAVDVCFGDPVARMTGFQKAEKSYAYKMPDACSYEKKPTEKPRFICCPSPEFLAEIGVYTHPQLKWLTAVCPHTSHMFYAGCATPEQMNQWLNWTLSEMTEFVSITDDIVAIDSNHSAIGMEYHRKLRAKQYPYMPKRVQVLYDAEENIIIKVGPFKLVVKDINASGIPDTSYKNSAPCIVHRVFAIAHAAVNLNNKTDSEILSLFNLILKMIYTSAAGDDGLTRTTRYLLGMDMLSKEAEDRYCEWWARCGFSVKVKFIPEHRWRMATYLAMRPVWTGVDYEWAPEPARRLKGMFWQIDNAMHPTAWARGVATQVLQQGRHCPVLSDICEWFLRITSGPIIAAEEKLYSPFAYYKTKGSQNERAIREFCEDYHIERSDIELMKNVLGRIESPYVNLGFHALRRVMLEES